MLPLTPTSDSYSRPHQSLQEKRLTREKGYSTVEVDVARLTTILS